MKQIAIQVRNSSNAAITGLELADFAIRTSPYTSDENISGLTVTEIGTQGNYVISGFTSWYENIKVFADTGAGLAEQTWIGIQDVGDLTTAFTTTATTQTISGAKTFSSVVVCSTPATSSTHLMRYGETVRNTGVQSIDGLKTFNTIPKLTGTRAYSGSNREIVDVGYLEENYGTGEGTNIGVNTNRLVVDSKQVTDVAGKIFNGIQEAITYAVTQTPSSTSRWTIHIMPHHSTGYAEDITISRFVDLIGWGKVYIAGGFTTSHVTTAQTWSARDARIENLVFSSTDKNYFFRLLHIKSCLALANGAGGEISFYIDGSDMNDFGIFTQNDVDLQANNTEQDNKAVNCYGNEEPVWETTDDVGSFTLTNTLIEL